MLKAFNMKNTNIANDKNIMNIDILKRTSNDALSNISLFINDIDMTINEYTNITIDNTINNKYWFLDVLK